MRKLGIAIAAALMGATLAVGTTGGSPARADFPDAYTQIVNHQIAIMPDGATSYLPLGIGRYYTGPNGLEVRLSSDGTWNTISAILGVEYSGAGSVVTGAVSKMAAVIISGIPPAAVRSALNAAGVVGSTFIADSAHKALLGNLCLAATFPDGIVTPVLDRGSALLSWNFAAAFASPYPSGAVVWFEQCQAGSVLSDSIVPAQFPIIQPVTPAQPISYLADRTILHGPDGSLYVMAGGAKFAFSSMSEFTGLGYSTNGMVNLDATTVGNIPTVPKNGTVLRSGGGNIYVVAGGAKFVFGSWGEYTGQGYTSSSYINVPQAPLDAIGDVPRNMPRNGTVVLRPDGSLYVIAGGVRWHFGTMAEFSSEGYSTFSFVPQAAIDGITDASATNLPANETVFQGTDSTIWVMKSGVRRSFTSMTQFTSMGYTTSQIIRVPDAVLSGIPSGGNLP